MGMLRQSSDQQLGQCCQVLTPRNALLVVSAILLSLNFVLVVVIFSLRLGCVFRWNRTPHWEVRNRNFRFRFRNSAKFRRKIVKKKLWFLVEKLESEFPISEFRYIMCVGLSIITQCQETTRHKALFYYWVHSAQGLFVVDCCVVGWVVGPPPKSNLVCLFPVTGRPPPGIIRRATLLASDAWRGWTKICQRRQNLGYF